MRFDETPSIIELTLTLITVSKDCHHPSENIHRLFRPDEEEEPKFEN